MQSAHTMAIIVRAAHSRVIHPGDLVDFDEVVTPSFGSSYSLETALGTDAALFEPAPVDKEQAPEAPPLNDAGLRTDGPTIEQFVAAGYKDEFYPPTGYAEQDSPGLDAYKAAQAAGGGAVDNIVEVNAATAIELIQAATTVDDLDLLAAVEAANPKHPDGRVSVMRAIEERRRTLHDGGIGT